MHSYENDVFISYSHLDNEPASPDDDFRWISEFHQNLESRLAKYLGERPKIWRDTNSMRPNEDIPLVLAEHVPKSAVLVPIFSPRYLRSEWCTRELNTFIEHATTNGCLKVNNKHRVFKVMKTPVPANTQMPEIVQHSIGYPFFQIDQNQRIREFDRSIYPESKRNYFMVLDDLAQDIGNLLSELKKDREATEEGSNLELNPERPKVFLAATGPDLRVFYLEMKRELLAQGYEVYPKEDMQGTLDTCKTCVADALEEVDLSIHMFGEFYEGISRLQNEVAAERSRSHNLPRMVWIPKNVLDRVNNGDINMDPPQLVYLTQWQTTEDWQSGASLHTGAIQKFKTEVLDALQRIEEERLNNVQSHPLEIGPQEQQAPPRYVYVVCSHEDREEAKSLKRILGEQGAEVRLCRFNTDHTLNEEYHWQAILNYDSVMIYWGAGDEEWLEDTLDAINTYTAEPHPRKAPLRSKAVLLAGERDLDKEGFMSSHYHVIEGWDQVAKANFTPFIKELNA